MTKISLCGQWTLTDGKSSYPASVPSCNFTDLLNNKAIPDPFFRLNEKEVQWVGEKDWTYTRKFELAKDFVCKKHVFLVFEMLDTLAHIYVNGQKVASTKNAYRTYRIDVKDYVLEGENEISVVFSSPLPYIKEQNDKIPLPNTTEGEAGSCHIRKPAYHFGWDWAPHLLHCGIMKPVYMQAYDDSLLACVKVVQKHENGKVILSLYPEFEGEPTTVNYTLTFPDGNTQTYEAGHDRYDITVDEPRLWWSFDLGDQPLYTLKAQIKGSDHSLVYKIGLRTLTLDTSKDSYGSNFCFVLNGVKVFARGANWVPSDSFVSRTTREDLKRLLGDAKRANMNMLRVWGGGYYESDDFYDLCDSLGILVWQDCMFACSPYPYMNKDFIYEVSEEIKDNVKRLRNHPALALWCGNNELEAMCAAWIFKKDVIARTKDFFYSYLPELIASIDASTPYHPGSPSGSEYLKNFNNDGYGDTHLWKVWHGMRPSDYLTKRNTRFCSEFGLQSFPHANTVKRMCGGTLPDSLDDPVLKAHQKAVLGNPRTLYYILDRFRSPESLADLIYLTQLSQAYCAQVATEHWRTLKGICNGSLYWQYNDCWGVTSWAGMDYYGNPKAVQYVARHFNSPVTVCIERSGKKRKIHIINDTLKDGVFRIRYGLQTFDGEDVCSYEKQLNVKAQTVCEVDCVDHTKQTWAKPRDLVIFAYLTDLQGNVISKRVHTLLKEKQCSLPDPSLQIQTSYDGKEYAITVKAKAYARGVELSLDGYDVAFSDNFFDLAAGESATVKVVVDGNKETLDKALTVKSLYDVRSSNSRLKDKMTAAKIFLQPFNLVNWIYRTVE